MVDFEISGKQYVFINVWEKTINLYDLNHTLTTSISYADFPQDINSVPTILYLSENLFNTDPEIEFMYVYTDDQNIIHTLI